MRRSIVQSSRLLANKKFISQQRFLHSTPSLLKDVMIKVPSMGDSISSGEINEWVKKPGQACVEDEVICTIDTDKVSVEIRAPEAGVLKTILANAKDTVEVGKDIAIIDTDGKPSATPAASTPSTSTTTTTASAPSTPTPTATPTPTPTPKKEEAKPQPTQSTPATTTPVNGLTRTERRVKMTRIRAKIAERLKQAQSTYAMLTTFNEIDMKKIMELRKVNQDDFQERHDGLKLGFMGAFCKAASIALTEVPAVNGVIDGNEIVYRDYVDISVAVATPNGLVVPVVRNCESKSIANIERDIANLGEKARKNAISLDDMQGGTFTISNGGVFGSLMGTPIINPPQSAILGMHATKNRPVAIGDQVVVRPMMYVALTYDHRIIDGREAVTFLKRVKELIEDPEKMLLF